VDAAPEARRAPAGENTARPRPPRLHHRLGAVVVLAVLGAIGVMFTLLSSALYYLLPPAAGEWLGRRGIGATFRAYFAFVSATRLARFDLRALDTLASAGPLVIAPNHPSLMDAALLLSRLPDAVCIMKPSVLDSVLWGGGARLAGYVPAEPPRAMIRRAVAALRAGRPVIVFPEGTRTVRWPVNPLKGSIAPIARLAGVPVQTVMIEMSAPFLGKGWPLARVPDIPLVVRVRLGERFAARADSHALIAELEAYYNRELAGAVH
jgi:1-acyl-sn-glycerol-3-phosphate acyltransferase